MSNEEEAVKSQKIKLANTEYCDGCPLLFFDEEKSRPSEYIGEGYYVHRCNLFNEELIHYLHHPLRLEECKDTRMKGAEAEDED